MISFLPLASWESEDKINGLLVQIYTTYSDIKLFTLRIHF